MKERRGWHLEKGGEESGDGVGVEEGSKMRKNEEVVQEFVEIFAVERSAEPFQLTKKVVRSDGESLIVVAF